MPSNSIAAFVVDQFLERIRSEVAVPLAASRRKASTKDSSALTILRQPPRKRNDAAAPGELIALRFLGRDDFGAGFVRCCFLETVGGRARC
jgi:hypothetical protein